MRCPHCHAEIPDGTAVCPACGRPARPNGDVIEPELLDGNNRPIQPEHRQFSRIFYTTFPSGQGMPPACLPTIVTLALALVAAFQFGLLAAIGFLVFAAIGRALTFFMTIRHLLEGRFFNPWVPHVVTWVVCWLLVAWLSGNLGQ